MGSGDLVLDLACSFTSAVEPTERVCQVAAMFGLGVDGTRRVEVVPPVKLAVGRGKVVFITGASGGGKSTLLRLIREKLEGCAGVRVIDFGAVDGGDRRPLVEAIGGSLEEATRWLALAGLNDAFVMLRCVSELSDGQRYRYRLARAMAESEVGKSGHGLLTVVLADEFGSALDRLTAGVIARNVRKWCTRSGCCFVAATAHDDLLEAIEPDVLVVQSPGSGIQVVERGRGE